MVITCISDLHAGIDHEDPFNQMYLNEQKFIKFMEDICGVCDLLVLNGDIFNTIEGKDWDSCSSRFMRIKKARPKLIEFIIDKMLTGKIRYIVGNTDWVIREEKLLPHAERNIIIDYEGIRVLIEHGHFPDMFGYMPFTTDKLISTVAYWTERLLWKDMDVKLAKFLKTFPASEGSTRHCYTTYAMDIGKRSKADVVILGHTHDTRLFRYNECDYINTGMSCDRTNCLDVTTIKIEKGRYGIVQKCVTI